MGSGRCGLMQHHSSSDRSVGYFLLSMGRSIGHHHARRALSRQFLKGILGNSRARRPDVAVNKECYETPSAATTRSASRSSATPLGIARRADQFIKDAGRSASDLLPLVKTPTEGWAPSRRAVCIVQIKALFHRVAKSTLCRLRVLFILRT